MLVAGCVALIAVVAQVGPDPSLLRPTVNLVSNCSFEAVDEAGQPLGWSVADDPLSVVVSGWHALHGRHCLLVNTPEGATAEAEGPAAWQSVSVDPAVDYVLSAWLRGASSCVGAVLLAVEFRDEAGQPLGKQQASWTGTPGEWAVVTLRFSAPPGTHRAVVQFLAPPAGSEVAVDAVSLTRADRKPPRRHEPPGVSNLRVAFLQPTWALASWEGAAAAYVVEWRPAGRHASWQRAEGVMENFYAIVNLAPNTSYEVRVAAVAVPFYDEGGRPLALAAPAPTRLLSFRTPSVEPRRWAGFRAWPAFRLDTFPDGVTAAALEAVGDRLYVLEVREGALYLSQVVPDTRRVEWTKLVVEPKADVDLAAPDMCATGQQLWIAWDSVPRSAEAPPGAPRRCVTSWDLTTGLRGEIVAIEPMSGFTATLGGSVAPFRGTCWLAWAERPEGEHASRIVLAPFNPESGLGARVIWDDCPAAHPRGPCLIPTDGDLGLAFTNIPEPRSEGGYEPLLWATFSRQRFTGLRALLSFGRASHPRGIRFGYFMVLAFESKTRFDRPDTGFTDIWLMRLGPGAGDITTFPYADDYKHNASPDLALCQGDAYVAYVKFEREPQAGTRPPKSYGTYLGRLEPEVKPGP